MRNDRSEMRARYLPTTRNEMGLPSRVIIWHLGCGVAHHEVQLSAGGPWRGKQLTQMREFTQHVRLCALCPPEYWGKGFLCIHEALISRGYIYIRVYSLEYLNNQTRFPLYMCEVLKACIIFVQRKTS